MADLMQAGAVEERWSDWIRGHENTRIRAAARIALANCVTQRTAAILLDQYHGALEAALSQIVDWLASPHFGPFDKTHATPRPEEVGDDLKAVASLGKLLARAPLGLHLTQPWQVVIAGPPNMGKSSLINVLLGYQRAIVFDQPGTTRDVVTDLTALDGWPIEFSDTAGLRTSEDPLESIGVERAIEKAHSADLLLLVFDTSQPWTTAYQHLVETWPAALFVHNKCDLPAVTATNKPAGLQASALTGEGIESIATAIVGRLVTVGLQPGDAVPFTAEQVEQLQSALAAVRSGDFEAACHGLLAMLA